MKELENVVKFVPTAVIKAFPKVICEQFQEPPSTGKWRESNKIEIETSCLASLARDFKIP